MDVTMSKILNLFKFKFQIYDFNGFSRYPPQLKPVTQNDVTVNFVKTYHLKAISQKLSFDNKTYCIPGG